MGLRPVTFTPSADSIRSLTTLQTPNLINDNSATFVTHLKQNHLRSGLIDMRTDIHDVLPPGTKRYRALFVSDLHLGTKACQAEAFLDFLRCSDAERIYLVGDIVDFWRIKRGAYWPQAHND